MPFFFLNIIHIVSSIYPFFLFFFFFFFFLTTFLGYIRVDKGGPDLLILTTYTLSII